MATTVTENVDVGIVARAAAILGNRNVSLVYQLMSLYHYQQAESDARVHSNVVDAGYIIIEFLQLWTIEFH